MIQTCLTGIKGEYILPKSIVKHIMEVVIDKLPHDEGLFIEKAFLLGALILSINYSYIVRLLVRWYRKYELSLLQFHATAIQVRNQGWCHRSINGMFNRCIRGI